MLATLAYDDLGRRTGLTRGNGAVTSYGYDPVSRLATLAEDMAGTTNDQSSNFSYSPASQIGSVTRTNDNYAWTGHGNGTTASVANGLNQLTSIGGSATTHDARGNVTNDPTSGKTYGYSSENLLTSASGGATLAYDPMMRLQQLSGAATTRFGYDGIAMIAEYDGANAVTKRYVHGPGVEEPLVEYDGSGTATKRWLHADERGSVIAQSDTGGNVTTINRYDEYGKPQATNVGRFQYTGQTWLSELGLYYYKARMYGPHIGRFWQTDPIGYEDSPNLYAYVRNDPVNMVDPWGMQACGGIQGPCPPPQPGDIVVTGQRPPKDDSDSKAPPCSGGTIVNTDLGSACVILIGGFGEPHVYAVSPRTGGRGKSRTPPKPKKPKPPKGNFCSVSPDQPLGVDASEACRRHDECYAKGSSRASCDRSLMDDIYFQCRHQGGNAAPCGAVAGAYYAGVRILGRPFWELTR